ncbi:MAG: GNAT family N-acetyltransferase [Phyllobacterium sp.]|uniref:GNAT family N-acetyltransferase n=1 Tax=Phyllobacterium sp. TaxID=1871046 RepID=UPI0030F17859
MTGVENDVVYTRETNVRAEEFHSVLASSGLGDIRPVGDLERLQRMLDNANLVITARLPNEGNRLVGIARGATDCSWFCYVSELAVMQGLKGMGIGRGLLAHAREVLGPEVALVLVSVPDAVPFYKAARMEPLPHCFWYRRER